MKLMFTTSPIELKQHITAVVALDMVDDPLGGAIVEKQLPIDPKSAQNLIQIRLGIFNNDVDVLAEKVFTGDITVGAWVEEMKQLIRGVHTGVASIAKLGWENMTPSAWGTVGAEIKKQYRYLQNFAEDILANKDTISLAAIQARAHMYGQAAGHTAALMQAGNLAGGTRRKPTGYGSLPWIPKDGSTKCLCILSGDAPVLTKRGWVPLLDVEVGDLVWTHLKRWRPVMQVIAKPSEPYHRLSVVHGVLATHNHLWLTDIGWKDSIDICNSLSKLCYNNAQEINNENLYPVWYSYGKSEQSRYLCSVSKGMSLRSAQGSSGIGVQGLHLQELGSVRQSQFAMENIQYSSGNSGGRRSAQDQTPGCGQQQLADKEKGWQALESLLDGRWKTEESHLSLSMGVDYGKWPHTTRFSIASHQWRPNRRQTGELTVDRETRALPSAWRIDKIQDTCSFDLPLLQEGIFGSLMEEQDSEVLLGGLLPSGTAVFDLTVEEDHSFCINGIFAHNSNCRCFWSIEVISTDADSQTILASWNLDPLAESCEDCVDRIGFTTTLTVPLDWEIPEVIG